MESTAESLAAEQWEQPGEAAQLLRQRRWRPVSLPETQAALPFPAFPRISVIIPTRNEALNLPHVLARMPGSVSQIVLVDGHSWDDTVAIAQALRPDITVVRQQRRGKGDALRCGLAHAHGDIVVLLDADGSTDPQEIDQFIVPLLDGADFVKGSRFAQGGGSADITLIRRLGNAALNGLVNILFRARFTDLCYGYNAFWRDCLECFDLDCDGFEVETQLNLRAHKSGLRIAEAPSYEQLRIHGESNLRAIQDGQRVLRMILREWRVGRDDVTERRYAIRDGLRQRLLGALPPGGAWHVATVEATPPPVALLGPIEVERDPAITLQPAPAPTSHAPFTLAATTALPTKPMDVSIAIAAYTQERWLDLTRAVRSAQQQSVTPTEILLVIDHNPVLAELARAAFPEVTVLENAGAQGLSAARNLAVSMASGSLVAFLDDDAIAEPDWLAGLLHAYGQTDALGVGGAITPQWRSARPAWFPDEFDWVVGCSYRGLPQRLAPTRNLIGASMLIRRAVIQNVGGFRTDLGRVGAHPTGCEETELCVQARQRWPQQAFLYEPRARVTHAVTADRATWRYFRARCYHEGRSKALMTRSVGARDGLTSEWRYTLRTLPLGVARNLWATVARRDPAGLARAFVIIAGLTLTLLGYGSALLPELLMALPRPVHMRSQHA